MLLAMALLLAAMAAVVIFASPYAPLVGGHREIEEIWAIEDTRTMSDEPLVTFLENNGVPLAYEREENTFYCTLGLENGDAWPELHLTAPGAKGVEICFVDDYSYDWCSDAIRDGYSYELIAYTDTQYAYFYVVFTGLPLVTIHSQEEIGDLDTRAQAIVSRCGDAPARSDALVHLRGAGSAAVSEKKSYTVDFVRGAENKSALIDVPMLGLCDDVILISCTTDATLMRDKLSWDMYAHLADGSESFGPRQAEYVEVFVNERYMGVYLIMQPVDMKDELLKTGHNAPLTDAVYRTTALTFAGERPCVPNTTRDNSGYELFYTPSGAADFTPIERYMALELEEDDDVFLAQALSCIDMESMMRHYLFVQGGAMSDNVFNNMYVWAHMGEDGLRYRFAPWDMDLTWGRFKMEGEESAYQGLFSFNVAQRLIDLDAGGTTQKMLVDMWTDMRSGAFNMETVESYINDYTYQLSESGAYARDSLRWRGEAYYPDGYEIVSYAAEHFAILDGMFEAYGYVPAQEE